MIWSIAFAIVAGAWIIATTIQEASKRDAKAIADARRALEAVVRTQLETKQEIMGFRQSFDSLRRGEILGPRKSMEEMFAEIRGGSQ